MVKDIEHATIMSIWDYFRKKEKVDISKVSRRDLYGLVKKRRRLLERVMRDGRERKGVNIFQAEKETRGWLGRITTEKGKPKGVITTGKFRKEVIYLSPIKQRDTKGRTYIRSYTRWSRRDEAFVIRNRGMSIKVLSSRLGKTPSSISSKRSRLLRGIRR